MWASILLWQWPQQKPWWFRARTNSGSECASNQHEGLRHRGMASVEAQPSVSLRARMLQSEPRSNEALLQQPPLLPRQLLLLYYYYYYYYHYYYYYYYYYYCCSYEVAVMVVAIVVVIVAVVLV
jgi:hypothetical protein